jgi:uncharacterized protein YrrD
MDAAHKLGRIVKVILDPDARRVAGFVVSHRPNAFANDVRTMVPAAAIHAIGPDAVTVRRAAVESDAAPGNLPSVGDIAGRKVVSHDGRFLGVIDDVLISGADCRIVGYSLANDDVLGKLQAVFVDRPRGPHRYLRADASLRGGRDLIVAPEEAVVSSPPPTPPSVEPVQTPPATRWFRDEPPAAGVHRP